MAALGGGRSTLANQGISRVMEATPPGYYRAYAERTSRNSTNCVLSRYPVKSRSTREIIQFLSICFIDNRPKAKQTSKSQHSTDGAKVYFLMTLLQGKALAWATVLYDKQSPVITSFSAFTAEMRKVFDHPVQGKEASKRIFSLCQGSRSVADHAIEGRTLSAESGWNAVVPSRLE